MCFVLSIQIKSYKIQKGSKAKAGLDAAFKSIFLVHFEHIRNAPRPKIFAVPGMSVIKFFISVIEFVRILPY